MKRSFLKAKVNFDCLCLSVLLTTFVLFPFSPIYSQGRYELIITEIFADPTPSHGLPEKEYIEIYNNSPSTLNLKGYKLYYGESDVEFPEIQISPGQYLIVCRQNNVSFLREFGEVVGLSKFSLLNTGTKLLIRNKEGKEIHQVSYSDKWYVQNRDQGYSLEMIDLNYPCRESGNWTSSSSEIGGTPGSKNASAADLPDLEPPFFVTYSEKASDLYSFEFSENLASDEQTLSVRADGLVIKEAYFSEESNNTILLRLEKAPDPDKLFEIVFSSISDCSGNQAEPIPVNIGHINFPEAGDILLSEILFNPKSGGSDFVELYNKSDKLLNLQDYGIARRNNVNEEEDLKIVFSKIQLIQPHAFICVTENKNSQIEIYPNSVGNNIIEVAQLPSFNNDRGQVILKNEKNEVVDSFIYHENRHHPSIDDPDGVSLERIRFEENVDQGTNWQSGSSSEGFATPGYKIWRTKNEVKFEVIATPVVFTPDNDGIDEECHLQFSSQEAGNLTAMIYDSNGRLITNLANNQYITGLFEYNWNGMDSNMSFLPVGVYIVYAEFRTSTFFYQNKSKIVLGK